MTRYAVYAGAELVGLTYADSPRQACELYRRYTGLKATHATREAA